VHAAIGPFKPPPFGNTDTVYPIIAHPSLYFKRVFSKSAARVDVNAFGAPSPFTCPKAPKYTLGCFCAIAPEIVKMLTITAAGIFN
jgi:hypothetical protein